MRLTWCVSFVVVVVFACLIVVDSFKHFVFDTQKKQKRELRNMEKLIGVMRSRKQLSRPSCYKRVCNISLSDAKQKILVKHGHGICMTYLCVPALRHEWSVTLN